MRPLWRFLITKVSGEETVTNSVDKYFNSILDKEDEEGVVEDDFEGF